jgi:hypothetical protein
MPVIPIGAQGLADLGRRDQVEQRVGVAALSLIASER